MSGHSHARTVKHQKDLNDQKRGNIFSKMVRLISVAVKEGGINPATNSRLRMAIDMAHSYKMPNDNIERAIKKSSGESGGEKLEETLFEAYGPGGTALLIEGITDNKNRALGEIKKVLSQCNGKMVGEGAVRWMFERKGCITINSKEQENPQKKEALELLAIEAGAEDIVWREENLDVYVPLDKLEEVKKKIEEKGMKIDSSKPDWKPKELLELSEKEKESCLKLFEALDEIEDVQDIYSNVGL